MMGGKARKTLTRRPVTVAAACATAGPKNDRHLHGNREDVGAGGGG